MSSWGEDFGMVGLGYRREMRAWDMSSIHADFFEVIPENWIHRDRQPLYDLISTSRPIFLHGVSLNIGGHSPIDHVFLGQIRALKEDLQSPFYSDHLAASGDAHQLYDLFPIPMTHAEVGRVSDRIKEIQDVLGFQIAVENATWYTNVGDMPETDFILNVLDKADCKMLLDLNNASVNHKNHGVSTLSDFVAAIDMSKVAYLHVAGHEFDQQLNMYIDTHSQPVERSVRDLAKVLSQTHQLNILLEWDNDVPTAALINQELACLKPFMTS